MNLKHLTLSAGVLIAGLAASAGHVQAQGPLYDKVIVDLPYAVSINNTILQPGHYVIRQLDSPGGGSRVLQIFTDNGMKLKTSAMTIPALDNNTPRGTSVVLHHYGSDYYFDKIWIQGKNYGYEFPLPPAVKSRQRERMEPYTVAASYESTNQSGATSATDNSSVNSAPVTSADSTPPAATDSNTASRSTTTTTTAGRSSSSDTTMMAQNRPPATTNNYSNDTASSSGNYSRRMPKTGGDWLTMLLSGGMLSGAGLLLRRSISRS